jgi:chemotaxis protein MotB
MRNDYYSNSKDYINRWVVSYADFVTMLLALFMVMFAVLRADNEKLSKLQNNIEQTFTKSAVENVTKYHVNSPQHLLKSSQIEKMLRDNVTQTKSIKFLKTDKGLIIRVNNTLLFDEGSAEIKSQAQISLNQIVKVLTKIDNPVIIEGHTDSKPIKNAKYPSNWELSTARATNIISYMMKIGGISPKRLCAVGYGEYMPVGDNTTNSGRMLNRRVDIIVLDK